MIISIIILLLLPSSSFKYSLQVHNAIVVSCRSRLYINNKNVETYYGADNNITDYKKLTRSLSSLFDESFIQSYGRNVYTPLPPMIHHIYVTEKQSSNSNIVDFIVSQTSLPKFYVEELLHIGAVYLSLPSPPNTTNHGGLKSAKTLPHTVASVTQRQNNIKSNFKLSTKSLLNVNSEVPSLSMKFKPKRVEKGNIRLPINSYLRVHIFPRRHLAIYKIKNWSDYILSTQNNKGNYNVTGKINQKDSTISEMKHNIDNIHSKGSQSIVFVNKQGGIPTLETVDNRIENLRYQVSCYLKKELYCLGRLDTCTSGIVGKHYRS